MPVKITQAQSHKIKIRYCINSYCAFEGKNCNSELQPSLSTGSRTFHGDQNPQMLKSPHQFLYPWFSYLN